jgi:hypothetical protein
MTPGLSLERLLFTALEIFYIGDVEHECIYPEKHDGEYLEQWQNHVV